MPASPSSVLSELVVSVTPVDGKSDCSNYHHYGYSSHKEKRVASQHGQPHSEIASTYHLSLDWFVGEVVVPAAKQTHSFVVVSETGDFEEAPAALVAEMGAASVARHVVAARGALDEHATHRTLSTVCHAVWPLLSPLVELPVALHKLPARLVCVPGSVTQKHQSRRHFGQQTLTSSSRNRRIFLVGRTCSVM